MISGAEFYDVKFWRKKDKVENVDFSYGVKSTDDGTLLL